MTNTITFYKEMTGSVYEGRAVNIGYFDIQKAFHTVSRNDPPREADEGWAK